MTDADVRGALWTKIAKELTGNSSLAAVLDGFVDIGKGTTSARTVRFRADIDESA